MSWTASRVRERIFRWEAYRGFVADYRPLVEAVGIPKRKRVTFEAWFVNKAIENAFFDEAFGLLDDLDRWLLIELYMKGGYDRASQGDPDIQIKDEVFDAVKNKLGMTGGDMMGIVNGALGRMLDYLNK